MQRSVALGMVALALGIGVARVAAGTNPNALTLAVIGDSPCLDPAFSALPRAEFDTTPAFIQPINATRACRRSSTSAISTQEARHARSAMTRRFSTGEGIRQPLVYTPGDNEWSDCTKPKQRKGSDVFGNGPDDNSDPTMPLWQLGNVCFISFASPGRTLAQHPMAVLSQSSAFDPQYPAAAQFVENVMWEQSKTVFVTVDVLGGSNNDIGPWYSASPNPAQPIQMQQRTDADLLGSSQLATPDTVATDALAARGESPHRPVHLTRLRQAGNPLCEPVPHGGEVLRNEPLK